MVATLPDRLETKDRRGGIACWLWASSIACGVVLGVGGAFITLIALCIGEGSAAFMVYAAYAAVLGAAVGFAIGLVVGSALGVVVTISPRAMRGDIMTAAIPVVALAVSLTPIAIIGHGQAVALFGVLDLTLTVAGAAWLLGRYRALEDRYGGHRVH